MKSQFAKVRFTQAELDKLKARADAQGASVSALVREAVVVGNTRAMDSADPIRQHITALLAHVGAAETMLSQVLAIARELLAERNPQALARIASSSKHLIQNRSNSHE